MRDGIRYKSLAASVTNYDDNAANSGVSYVYQVGARNDQGNGQNSNKVTIRPS